MISGYSGQEGCGKAAEFVGGKLKYSAEINPQLQKHVARQLPQAIQLGEASNIMELKPHSAEVGVFSTSCTSYSDANPHGKKNADPVTGGSFAEVGVIAEQQQFLVFASECTHGVKGKHEGQPSAVEELAAICTSYYLTVRDIDASEVISPLTGLQAAVNHSRTWVFGFNKKHYPEAPPADLIDVVAPKLMSFSSFLDQPHEGTEYRVMPKDDRRDLDYQFHQGPSGIAYVATISEPAAGRGHPNFVNRVVSAELGRCPVHTAAAGSVWVQDSLNGAPVVRLLRNEEIKRTMLVRGFDSGEDAELMGDRSEAGQGILGNMLPQNVPDMVMTQIALWLATVQPDGTTPHEKWSDSFGSWCSRRMHLKAQQPQNQEQGTHKDPSSAGRKRNRPDITPELDVEIRALVQYSGAERHFRECMEAKGWSPMLTGLTQMTITVYSGKGALHTCTRTIHRNQNNPSCPVAAAQQLHAKVVMTCGGPVDLGDSLFRMSDKSVLSRAKLALVLKAGALACGVESSRVATHSLRRGGASAYACAGVPDLDIQRFGRWTSDGYKRYITTHADMMKKGHADPAQVVPRFERN
eukprot:TRINITY_DN5172_c0_g1_i2.p1 TRINITY_DN5172_c0_g1~~TRINITY_DN5172_c0_g1_i2.p1  ORF type:complete len:580 (+),score=92.34 TRINITY_DN5172_c0_g1_i2:2542-4281(+)